MTVLTYANITTVRIDVRVMSSRNNITLLISFNNVLIRLFVNMN